MSSVDWNAIYELRRGDNPELQLPKDDTYWRMQLNDDLQLSKITITMERNLIQESHIVRRYGQRAIVKPERIDIDAEFVAMEPLTLIKEGGIPSEGIRAAVATGPLIARNEVLESGGDFEEELLALVYKHFGKFGLSKLDQFEEISRHSL